VGVPDAEDRVQRSVCADRHDALSVGFDLDAARDARDALRAALAWKGRTDRQSAQDRPGRGQGRQSQEGRAHSDGRTLSAPAFHSRIWSVKNEGRR
jgi:hypothetical protein